MSLAGLHANWSKESLELRGWDWDNCSVVFFLSRGKDHVSGNPPGRSLNPSLQFIWFFSRCCFSPFGWQRLSHSLKLCYWSLLWGLADFRNDEGHSVAKASRLRTVASALIQPLNLSCHWIWETTQMLKPQLPWFEFVVFCLKLTFYLNFLWPTYFLETVYR